MTEHDIFARLSEHGVVPVITITDRDLAVPLARAMMGGGLPVAEITFRTPGAADVVATLKQECPDLILGAGTVLSIQDLSLARENGAQFAVAPGLNPEIVEEAHRLGLPFAPGVATPTEIERALGLGARVLKFFPAEASGGPAMLRALAGPYSHLGVKFVPTGGVNSSNLEAYLSLDAVLCVGGSWVARKDIIAAKKWHEIRQNCREVRQLVAWIRGNAD
ncbi:MAG: bifunctional 4-hydroxy-2-oxoglutarate aldolase/2-dehydro-3-deoxy-phosphogluconate aldolase [Anaerolineae bacterium]|jgi:2-dehydro-3-deoxyphosphogluconate aldolase/(4S)-4-hydroxy-2-oxoglutarate aldolase